MSASDFENVLFNIREFFDKSTAQLLAAKSGAGRAELLHHLMDHELKASGVAVIMKSRSPKTRVIFLLRLSQTVAPLI